MLVGPINIVNQAGQAAVPANFLLSLTGSTGSVTNYHELDNVGSAPSNPIGGDPDRSLRVRSLRSGLTCNP